MDIFPWHGSRSPEINITALLNQSKFSNNFPKVYISGTTYIKKVYFSNLFIISLFYYFVSLLTLGS